MFRGFSCLYEVSFVSKYVVFLVFPETFVCIPTIFIVKTLHMALLMCSFIHLICLLICSATHSLILLSQFYLIQEMVIRA